MKLPCTAVGVLDAYTVQQSGSGVDVADPSSLVMVNNFLNALATNVDLAHEWCKSSPPPPPPLAD